MSKVTGRLAAVLLHPISLLILLALGVGVFLLMKSKRSEPVPKPLDEVARSLRVIQVPQVPLVPRVVGYGIARSADRWSAVAEVKGRIVHVHPELKAGSIFKAGEVVLRINPAEYELRIAQLEAEIADITAQEERLNAEEQNLKASLKIEEDSLALAERDLKRLESLASGANVSESEVDSKKREVLAQRQSVQNIKNSLSVLPAQLDSLAASEKAKQASLDLAKLDLSYTTIVAPFDCRVGDLALEVGQFLAAGQSLFEADGIDVTEVEALIPINQARTLLSPSDAPPEGLTNLSMETIRKIFKVDVEVRMESGDFRATWKARFDRVREQVDPQTRTIRIVVSVDKPYEQAIPGERPPLAPGMFCEVELSGRTRTGRIVIPRTCLRGNRVYVINDKNRLESREVEVAFSQGGLACITSGISPGEKLVVSDPTPAVIGMLVDPVEDKATEQLLIAESQGEVPLQ